MSGEPILLKDVIGVLDALAFEVNKKGRNVRRLAGKATDETIIARGQRLAWRAYRDGPLRDRFEPGNGTRWGFSKRSLEYRGSDLFRADNRLGKPGRRLKGGVCKGNLPDYAFTGRFRDQLSKRNPRRKDTPAEVVSRFSIFGGALNIMGGQRGRISETVSEERKVVTRPASRRLDPRSGKTVSVRSYQQNTIKRVVKRTPSPKTYAQEWEFTQKELKDVQESADANILEGFRGAIYSNGQIRPSIRERMRGAM